MQTELQTLIDLAAHYRDMVQNCTDAIKSLSGDIPPGFRIDFFVGKVSVVGFDIREDDGHFCLGLFMSWHGYYLRKLRETETQLKALELV
jgi:hypothetical protein